MGQLWNEVGGMRMSVRIEWKEKENGEISQAVNDLFKESKENRCPVNRLRVFSEGAMKKSCGECVICREGTYQIMVQCEDMTVGKGSDENLSIMEEIIEDMILGSCCSYGKEVGEKFKVLFLQNQEVFQKHYKRKRCDFAVCEKLVDSTPAVVKKEGGLMAGKRRRRSSQ